MIGVFCKATGIWILMALTAILNGVLRETVLVSMLGTQTALPVSGMLLTVLVFLVTLILIPVIGRSDTKTYLRIGIYWLLLTLSFEFLFGHYIAGKPWLEILQVFNLKQGDLFSVVLLVTVFAPLIAAKTRGLLKNDRI